jgi:hypothetical protein
LKIKITKSFLTISTAVNFPSHYFNTISTNFFFVLGYDDAMALITSMKEYRNLLLRDIKRLNSYSENCISRLTHLSALVAYPTTMEAQLQTYKSFEIQTKIINERRNNVQPIIDRYSKQVNQIYPKVRFSTTRKHYQTEDMKNSFKNARLPLRKILEKLENLRTKKQKLLAAIKNRDLDSSTNEEENKLEEIEGEIVAAEEHRKKKEAIYIETATVIFQDCQKLEKERLDQLNQALVDFIRVIHPSNYSTALVEIYENLLLDIKNKQNTIDDLNSYAQTCGVHTLISTAVLQTNNNQNLNDSATDASKVQ